MEEEKIRKKVLYIPEISFFNVSIPCENIPETGTVGLRSYLYSLFVDTAEWDPGFPLRLP